jgi:hypothetical protein
MLRVSHSFLRDQGIYYVLQPSTGQDMILAARTGSSATENSATSCSRRRAAYGWTG